MQIATPTGVVVETQLEPWQIKYCFYMAYHSGIGNLTSLETMLQQSKDHSLFHGAPARTYKAAYEAGYNTCLEELLS